MAEIAMIKCDVCGKIHEVDRTTKRPYIVVSSVDGGVVGHICIDHWQTIHTFVRLLGLKLKRFDRYRIVFVEGKD